MEEKYKKIIEITVEGFFMIGDTANKYLPHLVIINRMEKDYNEQVEKYGKIEESDSKISKNNLELVVED